MAIFARVPGGASSGIVPPVGDIGGTTADPTVVGFRGVPLSSTPATAGQIYVLTGGVWTPTTLSSGSGTVTSVSVVSANGIAGTVATATTTPAITLSVTATGLLKSNGTAVSAAVAGTDYVIPSALAAYAPLASPALTGTPTAPTATAGTNTTQIATTAFVTGAVATAVSGLATLASPTFTGTPAAPTATAGTNTTQLATTAFVHTAVAAVSAALTLITKTTLASAAASVIFSSIPSTYTNLKVMGSARSASSSTTRESYSITINAIASPYYVNGSYSFAGAAFANFIEAGGSAWQAAFSTALLDLPDAGFATTTDVFGNMELDIFNYASAVSYISGKMTAGWIQDTTHCFNGLYTLGLQSGPVTVSTITIATYSAANLVAGSNFNLYGVS